MPWIPCLELVNLESSRSWILSLGRGGSFSIQYEHSMYGAEVREHYLVGQGEIRLVAQGRRLSLRMGLLGGGP